MKHPLLTNPRMLLLYGLLDARCLRHGPDPVELLQYARRACFLIAYVQFLLWAVLALNIWYVVKYNTIGTNSWLRLILFHLIAATIIILIWVYITNIVVALIMPSLNEMMTAGVPSRFFSGYLFYVFYVFFFMAIIYYQNFKEKVKREAELKSLIREAELHALKSQINPHFLFNSLNSISSLTISDPVKAQEMVINLSSLMRYSLKHGQNEKVTFGTEIENNKLYLAIEKVRFGSKLLPLFRIDENCYKSVLPNMILQPIFENAIKYGVYEATEPVEIITEASCDGEFLEIKVSNAYDPGVRSKKGEGIGLRNIRERLQIIYGNPALLKIKDTHKVFSVILTIPQK